MDSRLTQTEAEAREGRERKGSQQRVQLGYSIEPYSRLRSSCHRLALSLFGHLTDRAALSTKSGAWASDCGLTVSASSTSGSEADSPPAADDAAASSLKLAV